MARLSPAAFGAKWLPRFADNQYQNITEATFRELLQDMQDSQVFIDGLTTNQVLGAPYYVPNVESFALIKPGAIVLGGTVVVGDYVSGGIGSGSEDAPAAPAAPVQYIVVPNETGAIRARRSLSAAADDLVNAHLVLAQGDEDDRVASYLPWSASANYRKGDVFKFTFAGGQTRLLEVDNDMNGGNNPEPTGDDATDDYYTLFASVSAGSTVATITFAATRTWGGINPGDVLTVNDDANGRVIRKGAAPELPATIVVTVSNAYRQPGAPVATTVSWVVTPGTNPTITAVLVQGVAQVYTAADQLANPAHVEGQPKLAGSLVLDANSAGNTTFSVSATDAGSLTKLATATVVVSAKRFVTTSATDPITMSDADLSALLRAAAIQEFSQARQQNRTINVPNGHYLITGWLEAGNGAGVFTLNGFPNGGFPSRVFPFTNSEGFQQAFRASRTGEKQFGTTTLKVD
ncbi:hypothetical protein [Hymenobacter sp. B81]|uniref:hypothetical protein n=1 Tax=Hymenobacter sp. B81 TaxID=3344878 RepID=UPI0037DD7A56